MAEREPTPHSIPQEPILLDPGRPAHEQAIRRPFVPKQKTAISSQKFRSEKPMRLSSQDSLMSKEVVEAFFPKDPNQSRDEDS